MKMMRPQIDESHGRKYNITRQSKIPSQSRFAMPTVPKSPINFQRTASEFEGDQSHHRFMRYERLIFTRLPFTPSKHLKTDNDLIMAQDINVTLTLRYLFVQRDSDEYPFSVLNYDSIWVTSLLVFGVWWSQNYQMISNYRWWLSHSQNGTQKCQPTMLETTKKSEKKRRRTTNQSTNIVSILFFISCIPCFQPSRLMNILGVATT